VEGLISKLEKIKIISFQWTPFSYALSWFVVIL